MKKSLLMVVTLLAVASLMAAMAFTTAQVTNVAALKVVNTNEALIRLEKNAEWDWENKVGFKDETAYYENGELKFKFGKGALGKFYGLQPNSSYEWVPLFTLRNMSKEKVEVTVKADGKLAEYITFGLTSQGRATAKPATATWGNKGQPFVVGTINPINALGDMWNIRNIAVKIEVPSGVSLSEITGSIIVEAVAVK